MWRTIFLINALLLVQMNSLNGGWQKYVYIYINYSLKQMIKKKRPKHIIQQTLMVFSRGGVGECQIWI